MKLICVEEHLLDPAIGQAGAPFALAEAPYLPDWGSRVTDDQVADTPRPHVLANAESTRKGLAPIAERLADMDRAGIDMQVLSYGGFPQLLPAAQAIDLCRAANDRLAAIIAGHPTRFSGFATLPWQAPDAAAQEMDRAAALGLKGSLINGRPGPDFLDAPQYAPVLAALNRLKLPLYIHPGLPLRAVQEPYYGGFERELSARLSMFAWGWHIDRRLRPGGRIRRVFRELVMLRDTLRARLLRSPTSTRSQQAPDTESLPVMRPPLVHTTGVSTPSWLVTSPKSSRGFGRVRLTPIFSSITWRG